MKKENEKLQKINSSKQNVAGGFIVRDEKKDKYSVYNDSNGNLVDHNLDYDSALKLDRKENGDVNTLPSSAFNKGKKLCEFKVVPEIKDNAFK